MLTMEGCRNRQRRLLTEMAENQWDLFLSSDYRTVYYLSGALSAADSPTIFLLWQDGSSALVTSVGDDACANEIVALETYSIQRCITHPAHDAAAVTRNLLGRKAATVKQCVVERAVVSGLLEATLHDAYPDVRIDDATNTILRLRKRKEEDEVHEIRESLRYCAVAYRAAKERIAAGLTEIDVYNAMYIAVVEESRTAIPFPGDFACGERAIRGGGPPTPRKILPGDLYILDLFPAPHLYAGDTCRTFAVGEPTDVQYKAWELVKQALRIGEAAVKPGVAARDVYAAIKEFLDSHEMSEKSFWHHAGHGIGFRGHEAPRIIPGTDDVFEVGDVIALEPGIYTRALQGGIRLENNYLVREDGLENLFDFPMDL